MQNNILTFVSSPKLLKQFAEIAVILSRIELASNYLQSKQILYQSFVSRRRTCLASLRDENTTVRFLYFLVTFDRAREEFLQNNLESSRRRCQQD